MGIRSFSLSAVLLFLPALALAQDRTESGQGPATTSGSSVVDEREAELQRLQREAEQDGASTGQVVVEPHPSPETPPAVSMTHESQLGLRLGLGVPFIFAVKYGDGVTCDDEGNEFCRRFGAPLLDLELSFGVSDTVELGVLARFGLADDEAANANPLAFGIGARAYTSAHAMLKASLGGRFMIDLTSSDVPDWGVDVGARGELGLQLDVIRHLGFYAQIGATIMILRSLSFAFDGTGGVQGRLP